MKNVGQGIRRIMTSGAPDGWYRKVGSTYTKLDEEGVVGTGTTYPCRNGVTVPTSRTVFDAEIKK
jgi:hypothetical protein